MRHSCYVITIELYLKLVCTGTSHSLLSKEDIYLPVYWVIKMC